MSEPTSTTSAIIGWKLLGLSGIFGAGVLGGAIMALFDPPKTRRGLLIQGSAAGIGSLFFGPIAVRFLDHYIDWVDLTTVDATTLVEWVAPVYLIVGCLSWGMFAMLAKLREKIASKGADKIADKAGL